MGMEELVPGDGWISDDSSFYGDENEQERLEVLCDEFRPADSWSLRKHDLNAVVFKHRTASPPDLNNPGEGQPGCWQLGETVDDFVKRLPPVTTSALLYDWIWVHNPYPQGRSKPKVSNTDDFVVRGQELLARSLQTRKEIDANDQTKNKGAVTKHLNEESKLLQQRIANLAAETNVLSGKWMLFLSPENLGRTWGLIVDGIISNRLGPTAKVAPDNGKTGERLICIYTKDFRDKDDVLRVLEELVSIGVVDQENRPIHYKSDPYTYLNIYKKTAEQFGLQASLYSSQKLLAEAKRAVLDPRKQSSLNHFIKTPR